MAGEKAESEFAKAIKALRQAAPALELSEILIDALRRAHEGTMKAAWGATARAEVKVMRATMEMEGWRARHTECANAYADLKKELDAANLRIRTLSGEFNEAA